MVLSVERPLLVLSVVRLSLLEDAAAFVPPDCESDEFCFSEMSFVPANCTVRRGTFVSSSVLSSGKTVSAASEKALSFAPLSVR